MACRSKVSISRWGGEQVGSVGDRLRVAVGVVAAVVFAPVFGIDRRLVQLQRFLPAYHRVVAAVLEQQAASTGYRDRDRGVELLEEAQVPVSCLGARRQVGGEAGDGAGADGGEGERGNALQCAARRR
jgi:hypothetical protein